LNAAQWSRAEYDSDFQTKLPIAMRHVFVDESCQNAHQFMILGALIMPGDLVAEAERHLANYLAQQGTLGEFKWTKVSRSKLDVYRGYISYYFDSLVPRGATFSALVVDSREIDHHAYNDGDPDLGFNKFLYQLLFHRVGRVHGLNERIVVDLDARNTTRDAGELNNVLNAATARYFGDQARRPFARVAHRDSKNSRLLQLADLLTGAVAWHKNDHDAQPGASESKIAMAAHIAGHIGLRRLGANSVRAETRLNVWNFQLRARQGWGARQSRPG
jgi:hypothetical protein